MTAPRPTALRLLTSSRAARLPTPPFELRTWSDDASAIAVLLDADGIDLEDSAEVAAQLPHASDLPRGTVLFVIGTATNARVVFGWLARSVKVSRSVRCTALVAQGYVGVGAGTDAANGADLAWGLSSLY